MGAFRWFNVSAIFFREGRGEERRRALNVVRKSPVWKRHDFDFAQ